MTPSTSANRPDPSLKLSSREEADFFDRGFFIREAAFRKDEIDGILKSFERLYELGDGLKQTTVVKGTQFVIERGFISRIVWCGAAAPELLKFGEDPRITTPVAELLRSAEADQLICQAHFKMPGDNVEYRWHQDSENRGYGTPDWTDVNGRGSYVQTVMAIDRMHLGNGPMWFAPGTCKRGHLGLDRMDDPSQAFDKNTLVPVEMSPGSVAFFGPYAIHGSLPNPSDEPRRIFINGFASPGANKRSYPGEGSGRRVRLAQG